MTLYEVSSPVDVRCAGGAIRVSPSGRTEVLLGEAVLLTLDTDLAVGLYMEAVCLREGIYAVGLEATQLWFANPSAGHLQAVVELDRVDLKGHYDPGGFYSIEFHPAQGFPGQFLVYETGIALLDEVGNAVWHRVHNDLTARFEGQTEEGDARLVGDGGLHSYRLRDGQSR